MRGGIHWLPRDFMKIGQVMNGISDFNLLITF